MNDDWKSFAQIAEQAANEVMYAVRSLAEADMLSQYRGHIVIMDPAKPYTRGDTVEDFEKAIAFQASYTDPSWPWKYDYQKIALAKAMVTWRYGVSSRESVTNQRYLLDEGAAPWAGSVVWNGNLFVAFSGLPSQDDEWICHCVAARIVALEYAQQLPDSTLLGGEGIELAA